MTMLHERPETGLATEPARERTPSGGWLLLTALFGLVVPNGLFAYWLLFEFDGLGAVLHDKLALGFILDAVLALVLLSVYFARHPIGRLRWPWFVALSLVGGLGFSLPLYYWLNRRPPAPRNTVE